MLSFGSSTQYFAKLMIYKAIDIRSVSPFTTHHSHRKKISKPSSLELNMVQKLVLAVTLCITSTAIAAKLPGTLIVGGVEAAKNQFPYLVRFWIFPTEGSPRFCSGTLIALDLVLTSASCVQNYDKQIIVTAGDHSVVEPDGTEQTLTSQEVIVHENFNSTGNLNNIALIKLSGKFEETDAVEPVPLPSADINTDNSEFGIAAGWGATVVGDINEDELHTANISIWKNAPCATEVELNEGDFCTLDFKGGLQSDNGGPLICSENLGVVCGIMSNSLEVGDEQEILGLYVNVSFYLKWIEANMPVEPTTTTAATTATSSSETSSTTTVPPESSTAGSASLTSCFFLTLVSILYLVC